MSLPRVGFSKFCLEKMKSLWWRVPLSSVEVSLMNSTWEGDQWIVQKFKINLALGEIGLEHYCHFFKKIH